MENDRIHGPSRTRRINASTYFDPFSRHLVVETLLSTACRESTTLLYLAFSFLAGRIGERSVKVEERPIIADLKSETSGKHEVLSTPHCSLRRCPVCP